MLISAVVTVARALARRTSAFISSRLRVSSSSAVAKGQVLRAEVAVRSVDGRSDVLLFMMMGAGRAGFVISSG